MPIDNAAVLAGEQSPIPAEGQETDRGDELLDALIDEAKEPEAKEPKEPETPRDDQGRFTKKDEGDIQRMIPKARFDEILQRAKAAEEQLLEAQRALEEQGLAEQTDEESPSVEEVDAEIQQLVQIKAQAMQDGDMQTVAEADYEIIARQNYIAQLAAYESATAAQRLAVDQVQTSSLVGQLEQLYPELNPDRTDAYSQEKVDLILTLQQGFVQQGMSAAAAMARAVNGIMGPPRQAQGDNRVRDARTRNLDAARRQPNNPDGAGLASDKAGSDVLSAEGLARMSEEDFEKLPEATRKRMRGDMWEGT